MMIIVKMVALVVLFGIINYTMNCIEETVNISKNPVVEGN